MQILSNKMIKTYVIMDIMEMDLSNYIINYREISLNK